MTGRKNNDATKNLRPSDERQTTPKGLKIGRLPRGEILRDLQKVIRRDRTQHPALGEDDESDH